MQRHGTMPVLAAASVALVAFLAAGSPRAALAAAAPGQRVAAIRAASAPPLDTAFDQPVWSDALTATDFTNTVSHQAAPLPTTAKLLYDDKNLYVAFVAEQRSVPVTATQSVNDAGYGLDDSVTVGIDTSGANARTYTFSATPRGVRYETSSESARYQPPWTAIAKLTPDGYRVMMVIPLADMRLQASGAQNWRINFSRRIAATGDLYTWAYDAASNAYCTNNVVASNIYCDATRWPLLVGVRVGGATARPKPYADLYGLASGGSAHNVYETNPGYFTTQKTRSLGADVTYPITRTLSFVGTLGPDFSNVEADQTTIAPQEFVRHYTEYRPFFAQGFSYIDALPHVNINGFGSSLFYSPALGVVSSGYKVEGTAGRNQIGVLAVNGEGFGDQVFGYQNARPDGSLSFSAEGVFAHHPGLVDDAFGIGGAYQNLHSGIGPLFSVEQEQGTLVDSVSQARNLLGGVIVQHGPLLAVALYRDIGPEFNPIDGFTPINDVRGPQMLLAYNGVGPSKSAIKSYSASAVADRFIDRSGAAHQADVFATGTVTLKSLLSFSAAGGAGELRAYDVPYPVYSGGANYRFNQTSFAVGYKDGTPSPTDASYSFGPFSIACEGVIVVPLPCNGVATPFAPGFVQQLDLSTSRTLRGGYGLALEYAGTLEHGIGAPNDSEWLRRVSLSRAFGRDAQLALSVRSINGTGGFAPPGTDIAVSFHQRFRDQSQLYVQYGTPAAYTTLQRIIVKYVHHFGGGAGT
ncbi:MAG TPA: sugar-binding protein [Candidatus Elarobacter sp.]|jgi:hypothetical protein|nr:sugar-binding protein [Candidatus Elarobacter sp.]